MDDLLTDIHPVHGGYTGGDIGDLLDARREGLAGGHRVAGDGSGAEVAELPVDDPEGVPVLEARVRWRGEGQRAAGVVGGIQMRPGRFGFDDVGIGIDDHGRPAPGEGNMTLINIA